jgi:hypothetical protein
LVDPLVGTLSGEPHRKQKLMGLGILKGADPFRIFLFQGFNNMDRLFFLSHGVIPPCNYGETILS